MKYSATILLASLIAVDSFSQINNNKTITSDNYPVTDKMLGGNGKPKKCGEVVSLDRAWFTNDTLQQTIVFDIYTDYHRGQITHFYNAEIPDGLLEEFEFNVATGVSAFGIATAQQRQKSFDCFVGSAARISKKYFKSIKGFQLGDSKMNAINIYGLPDKSQVSKGIEKCTWRFEGDHLGEDDPPIKTTKPLAKESFGYTVEMFFSDDKLKAMVLHSDIL